MATSSYHLHKYDVPAELIMLGNVVGYGDNAIVTEYDLEQRDVPTLSLIHI